MLSMALVLVLISFLSSHLCWHCSGAVKYFPSLPPAHSSVRAVEGRQRTRYDRFETEAFIMVRRTCTYIYEHQ